MLLALATLIMAGLSGAANERQARGRIYELRHRLGAEPALRGMARRLVDVQRTQGEAVFWIMVDVLNRLGSRDIEPAEERAFEKLLGSSWSPPHLPSRLELGPMVPWLAAEVLDMIRAEPGLEIVAEELEKAHATGRHPETWGRNWAAAYMELRELDLTALLDWYTYTRPLLDDYDLNQAQAEAERWHAALPIPAALGGARKVHGEVLHRFEDGWTVQNLITREQAAYESRHLNHCVGIPGHGYFRRMAAGLIAILSLRDDKGIPKMTWEIGLDDGDFDHILQAKGQLNATAGEWDEEIREHAWEYQKEQLPGLDHWDSDAWELYMESMDVDIEDPVGHMRGVLRQADLTGDLDRWAAKTDDYEMGLRDAIVEAWAQLIEEDEVYRLPGPVANQQLYMLAVDSHWDPVERKWILKPPDLKSFWRSPLHDNNFSQDDEQDIPPIYFFLAEEIVGPEGRLQVYAEGLVVYESESYAYMDGNWNGGVRFEVRWLAPDGRTLLETPGFATAVPDEPWTRHDYSYPARTAWDAERGTWHGEGAPQVKGYWLSRDEDVWKAFFSEGGTLTDSGPSLRRLVVDLESELIEGVYIKLELTPEEKRHLEEAFPQSQIFAEVLATGATGHEKRSQLRQSRSPDLPMPGLVPRPEGDPDRFGRLRRRSGRQSAHGLR